LRGSPSQILLQLNVVRFDYIQSKGLTGLREYVGEFVQYDSSTVEVPGLHCRHHCDAGLSEYLLVLSLGLECGEAKCVGLLELQYSVRHVFSPVELRCCC